MHEADDAESAPEFVDAHGPEPYPGGPQSVKRKKLLTVRLGLWHGLRVPTKPTRRVPRTRRAPLVKRDALLASLDALAATWAHEFEGAARRRATEALRRLIESEVQP